MPPKRARELTAIEVKDLGDGRHLVGGVSGLMLYVKGEARSWVLRVTIAGRRREAGLGPYPEVRLAQARALAAEFRAAVRAGRDPIADRETQRRELRETQARAITFSEAARRFHRTKSVEFRSEKHRADWINSLAMHAFPHVGDVQVSEFDQNHALRVLEPIWTTKTETATRVRQRMEAVLDWAKVSGFREGDNPAAWRGNLESLLPKPTKVRRIEHFPALPYPQVGPFVSSLRQREGTGARALEFIILTVARSREVRFATWAEVDLDNALWTIAGDRMKAGKPHSVPLSAHALRLLSNLQRGEDHEQLFPTAAGGPVSDGTIGAVIKRMHDESIGAGGAGWVDPATGRRVTSHGFRSTFKDWARTCTRYPDEASELALAHVNDDRTRAAYARDQLVDMRRGLMQEWAAYAYGAPASDSVVPIRGKACID